MPSLGEFVPCPEKNFSLAEQQVFPGEAAKTALLGAFEHCQKCKYISQIYLSSSKIIFKGDFLAHLQNSVSDLNKNSKKPLSVLHAL